MRKFERILVAISSAALLATAACGTTTEADGDAVDGTASDAATGTDASTTDTGPALAQYFYLVIYDADKPDCSTTGPGADIDSVELVVNGATIGAGLKLSADFIAANPSASVVPCKAGECGSAGNKACSHAATAAGGSESIEVAMGTKDAKTYCGATVDTGYVSLNGGSLRFQIGDATGAGAAQFMQAGDIIRIHEVDKSYTPVDGGTCVAKDENYSVEIRKTKDAAGTILKSKAGSETGSGVTEFVVP